MSKPSKRPNREERKAHKKVLAAKGALREQQKKDGTYQVQTGVSNTTSAFKTVEEERQGREEAVAAQIQVFRVMLPTWLKQLSTLDNPRQAKKVKYKLAVVLLFGLLSFVFQMSSRRQANAQMSKPCFRETLQSLFTELESLPHADTLNRVLEKIGCRRFAIGTPGVDKTFHT